ncbi:Maf-like protein YhdE [Gimesia aquarii]|uniref:dTTP/UTP pyrophosphatase n=2 Tax=Gimesia aquarii TaxID=2527964 RepID=A0A517WQV4_9PLAN|nr:Maf-like protein YhdE [Gimesia aquarii]
MISFDKIILGSRSPRRRELLSQMIPISSIEVIPPQNSEEADFEQLCDLESIRQRLISICKTKNDDVLEQVKQSTGTLNPILTADTIVVVGQEDAKYLVLGQPPETGEWEQTVRQWFTDYYAGKTHRVLTGLCFRSGDQIKTEVVQTLVTFHGIDYVNRYLDWYLSIKESLGKAGGYAIQESGTIFVQQIEGSLSNVVGLPLEQLVELFH